MSPRTAFALMAALAASTLVACGPRGTNDPVAARPSGTGSRSITREMIAKWNVLDAYEAVQRSGGFRLTSNGQGNVTVRRQRGQSSITNSNADRPVLVIDGAIAQDFEMLRRIRVAEIERIDLLSGGDAVQRFGTSSSGAGAIVIVTRSGQ
ncbi:MAG TPA: TonB-dependent receptor plug domain-containing protein [Gemmatimonas sp.]|nr:TonB-dependent receptor plug domain-containing protein [Gemmatimonas sp.]